MANRLEVAEFAHIKRADIEFGDLTVLVGPQAAGKSLLLQLWKLALDWNEVLKSLHAAGYTLPNRKALLNAFLGEGMGTAWRSTTRVRINGQEVDLQPGTRNAAAAAPSSVFYVPAHRAMLVSSGWALPLSLIGAETPFVARLFSQALFDRFSEKRVGDLFPVPGQLKKEVRDLIDAAVFHGGTVRLRPGLQKRLELRHGDTELPFMTWTAGQREFTPLLLGLYDVIPPRSRRKNPSIDWVIIEEPEMGLHPQATTAVMALVLELMWRGYKVVLSTHAPIVLDVVFAMRELAGSRNGHLRLQAAFGLGSGQKTREMLKEVLGKSIRTFALTFDANGKTTSVDISDLDPGSERGATAGWGGLTEFSGRFGNAVARTIAEERT